MYAGVDEAGRGPVLGPLLVAGVLADPDDLPDGVGDSKTIPPEQRRHLRDRIHEAPVRTAMHAIPADELNDRMADGETLDEIEETAFAHVLDELGPERALVDAVGSDTQGFARRLADRLDVEVEARKGADATDPVVGAASILAKVARDEAMERIGAKLDADVGSGYPSDPTTRSFLQDRRKSSRQVPPHARSAWSTLEDMGFGQARLDEYENGGTT